MIIKDDLGEIGPFYRAEMFTAWMQEAVKMICNSGVVFGHHFKDVDLKILGTKARYITDLNDWRRKYLGNRATRLLNDLVAFRPDAGFHACIAPKCKRRPPFRGYHDFARELVGRIWRLF